MDDVRLLLRACRESPGDDAPRLMLADELQYRGNEGAAQFIRESIHVHRHGAKGKRWRAPSGRKYAGWLAGLLGVPDNYGEPLAADVKSWITAGEGWDEFFWRAGERRDCRLVIRRGLPEELKVTAPLFMERTADLFMFPIGRVRLSDRRPSREQLFDEVWYDWNCAYMPQKFNTWEETDHHVPKAIYDLLPKDQHGRVRGTFPRKADAVLSLEAAALEFGLAARKLVDTPKAEPTPPTNVHI